MYKLVNTILNIIYPPRCVFCYEILGAGGPEWVCGECEKEVSFIRGAVCLRCGMPVEVETEACDGCREREFHFGQNHALFIYEGNVREAVHRFKYKGKPRYAKYFGRLISEQYEAELRRADIITEGPLHAKKLKARGYNQAELLAAEISANAGVPHIPGLLARIKKTKVQSALHGYTARENNIKGAFAFNSSFDIKEKNIILADDIFTTGSTANECARVLKEAGAESVCAVTLSIALKKKMS